MSKVNEMDIENVSVALEKIFGANHVIMAQAQMLEKEILDICPNAENGITADNLRDMPQKELNDFFNRIEKTFDIIEDNLSKVQSHVKKGIQETED